MFEYRTTQAALIVFHSGSYLYRYFFTPNNALFVYLISFFFRSHASDTLLLFDFAQHSDCVFCRCFLNIP